MMGGPCKKMWVHGRIAIGIGTIGTGQIMQMRLKAIIILFIILVSLIPAYSFNNYLQKIIRPGESLIRLLLYMLTGMLMVFLFTLLIVLLIKLIFPGA